MGENIHAKHNRLEKKHQNQKNRGKRFFLVIRDFVDENRCDRKHLKKKKCQEATSMSFNKNKNCPRHPPIDRHKHCSLTRVEIQQ